MTRRAREFVSGGLLRSFAPAAVAALGLVCLSATTPRQHPDDAVKATFLVKFTDFVEWPAAALAAADEPFRICVAADPAFGPVLDRRLEGEKVRGHTLRRVSVQTQDDLRSCQVLYVAAPEQEHARRLLAATRGAPVLTVGDTPEFLQDGGAIQFVRDGGRVRFDVDRRATREAGLTVSSKLLRVARHVFGNDPTR